MAISMESRKHAERIFEAKWPAVQRCVEFHVRRRQIRQAEWPDVFQHAAVSLWEHCLRAISPAHSC